jgi:transposase
MERRSVKIAAIALANKIARIAWAMMTRNEGIVRANPLEPGWRHL